MPALRTDDLVIPQGTTWETHWPVQNTDGTVADLTGWKVKSEVRANPSDPEVLHTWSTDVGNAIVSDGEVILTLIPEVSSAWTWREGVYDIKLYRLDGTVVRLTQGMIYVNKEVTR